MSGRSIGLISCHMSGVRVTNKPTYIPAHINAQGKRINAKCTIPVAKNSHKGTRPDGTPGRTDYFTLTAWGKLADIMARSCPKGKALDVLTEPRFYRGRLFDTNGNVRLDAAGQPIEIPKISFNMISYPVFGEDSEETIATQIRDAKRPQNWNVKDHPDFELWKTVCKANQAKVWDGQSAEFGEARVVVPQGVQLDFTQGQGNVAPAAGSVVPSVAGMVQQAVNQQPVQQQVVNPAPAADMQPDPRFAQYGQPAAAPAAPVAPTAPAMAPGANINQVI